MFKKPILATQRLCTHEFSYSLKDISNSARFCQLDTLESSGMREPQLRNCIHQNGLWTVSEELIND